MRAGAFFVLITIMSGTAFGQNYIIQEIDFDLPGGITDYGDVWGIHDGQAQFFNVLDGEYVNLREMYDLHGLSQVSSNGTVLGNSFGVPVVVGDTVESIPLVLNFPPTTVDNRAAVSGVITNQNSIATYADGRVTSVNLSGGQESPVLSSSSSSGVLAGSFWDVSSESDRPFVISGGTVTYPEYTGYVRSVNNGSTVVGTNESGQGVVWSPDTGSVLLGGGVSPIHVNNLNRVVGHDQVADTGFVYQDEQYYDLNSFVDRDDVVVRAATYTNNSNQILVQIEAVATGSRSWAVLSPVYEEPMLYEVVDPTEPISRLGRWNGETFVPVAQGEIQSGDSVHVMTHGWKPGYLDAVESNPGLHVWDPEAVNAAGDRADLWMFEMAEMLSEQDPSSKVYAFSWIDKSATGALSADDLRSVRYASLSQAQTELIGDTLRDAFSDAISGVWNGELHLLGHSHGSKVVTEGALGLERSGVNVAGLTILDSPETGVTLGGLGSLFTGGSNNLESKLEQLIKLSPETFIDSYYSKFGEAYDVPGVVDVFIQAEHLADIALDVSGRHTYPIEWYIAASRGTSDLALHWQDVMPTNSHYIQDWLDGDDVDQSRELVLSPYDPTILDHPLVENGLRLVELVSEGVTGLAADAFGNQVLGLLENSPAYLHTLAVFDESIVNLLFDYELVNSGDGDELGIWIDGELVFILSGFVSDPSGSAIVDLTGIDPGVHVMTFGLHSYGEANAEFEVSNLRTQSINTTLPEPATICMLGVVLGLLSRRR